MSMGEMNPSNLFLCCHRLNYAGRMCSFENIMVKFHEHVYVVPYEYHWECYEMVDVML